MRAKVMGFFYTLLLAAQRRCWQMTQGSFAAQILFHELMKNAPNVGK